MPCSGSIGVIETQECLPIAASIGVMRCIVDVSITIEV
jgi:hypothetical protein